MYLFEDVLGTSVITGFERVWACEEWQVWIIADSHGHK